MRLGSEGVENLGFAANNCMLGRGSGLGRGIGAAQRMLDHFGGAARRNRGPMMELMLAAYSELAWGTGETCVVVIAFWRWLD